MTVTVETGSGVKGANSYVPSSFVLAFLTDRNRDTAWTAAGATVQDAAVVAGTDYIEIRYGQRFKGVRRFSFTDKKAVGSVTFTGVPVAAETLTLGDQTYTFVTTLSDPDVADEILIGVDADANALNLKDAIMSTADQVDVTFSTGTEANRHATATVLLGVVTLTALSAGESGNFTTLSGAVTNATLAALAGGVDGGSQPLSFPQSGLFDRAGIAVTGVPLRLREATAEYADRARVAILAPDPTIDAVGGSVIRLKEKVGPIETDTEYSDGTSGTIVIRPYPAADKLLQDYITPAGVAVR